MKTATRFTLAPGHAEWVVALLSNGKIEARRDGEVSPGGKILSRHGRSMTAAIAARDEARKS